MNFTITDRQAGKTTRAVRILLANSDAVLVCAYQPSVEHAQDIFRRMGGVPEHLPLMRDVKKYLDSRIMTFAKIDTLRGRRVRVILDDADVILANLCGANQVIRVFATGVVDPL